MPMLTKKFTRDSLKRASGAGTPAAGGSDDPSQAEMIRLEMARARSKSMRHRNAITQQQRRHRSLSRGPSSKYLDTSGSKILSHRNDSFGLAHNETELLTAMSSLTEPTWAPSDLGNSSHHQKIQSNQRNRTTNYNNMRHQTRLQRQDRTTLRIPADKEIAGTKVPLRPDNRDDVEIESGPNENQNESNHGHHDRASVGREGIEIHRVEKKEVREHTEDNKISTANMELLPTQHTRNSDARDDAPRDDETCSTRRTTKSFSSKSKHRVRREDKKSNAPRTRGRSGRPQSRKRSSSISSRRSAQSARTATTAPTVSKHSSSSTISTLKSSEKSRKSASRRNRTTDGKKSSSISSRSSSVPPTMSNSKRKQRTLSVPPSTQKLENNRMVDRIILTSSTMGDTTTLSSQSFSNTTISEPSKFSHRDSPLTPSSAAEAARMSLRPKLRRSNSNRSLSSTQSESVMSTASSRQRGAHGNGIRQPQRSLSVTPALTREARYSSRNHAQENDARAKRIHERRLQRRSEREREEQRLHYELKGGKANAALSIALANDEEAHFTTMKTLLYDFLFFHLLLLLSFPTYVASFLWSRTFSKKWSACRKNVLVTGANSALASETARQFASQGANLILISHSTNSSENVLDMLVEECRELGSTKVRTYSADLSNAVSAELTLRQAAKDFNDTFDVVVLNGDNKSHGCLFEEILDVHQIEKMMKENTIGCMLTLHYAIKHVPKTSDARVVILSHTSGMVASPYKSVYGATQHALKGFCDSIRMELNDTYSERRAPKICFASFPELTGQHTYHQDNHDCRVSWMGANSPPMKTRSWASTSLQKEVHGLLGAIGSGERGFGTPRHVKAWKCIQTIAPRWTDFSVFRHTRRTEFRPVEVDPKTLKERKRNIGDGASVGNKTWA